MSRNHRRSTFDWAGYEARLAMLAVDPRCAYCRATLTRYTSTRDHVVPLARGGADEPGNVVLACKNCNARKGDMLPLDFIVWRVAREAKMATLSEVVKRRNTA